MAGAWVVSIVSCGRCGKGAVARWGEHGPRSGISQQSESLLRRYCTVRRVGEIGLGSCSAFPFVVSGPLCWLKRTSANLARPLSTLPQSPGTTSAKLCHPHHLSAHQNPSLPGVYGVGTSDLAYPHHGFIRCAAASLRPRPGKASFATWQSIQSCRGYILPPAHSLAGDLGAAGRAVAQTECVASYDRVAQWELS